MQQTPRGLLATDCEVAAARWVQRKLGDCQHERRVLAVASKLFDLTRSTLRLGMSEMRLLRLSSLLHDIGRSVNDKDHPIEGANMILGTTILDLSPYDRRALAFLTRYHRGTVPDAGPVEYLRSADPRTTLLKILGLLRVADGLDNRQIASPQLVCSLTGRKLNVQCYVDDDFRDARRIYKRKKKYALLESFLGEPIEVEVYRADMLAMID